MPVYLSLCDTKIQTCIRHVWFLIIKIRGGRVMIIEQLRKQEGFSPSESALAAFILDYGEELAYLSIHEIADMSYTSTTTIRRLAQKVGCEGFRDFKIQYLKEVTNPGVLDEVVDVNHPFHFGAQPSLIANNLALLVNKAVQETLQSLDYTKINKAVDLIRKADYLFLYGVGDSAITLRAFQNRLAKLKKIAVLTTANSEQSVYSTMATERTTALFVSYRGGSTSMFRCAQMLERNHVPWISLSSQVTTYITDHAAVSLTIPPYEIQSDNIATFYSQECFSFILNVIYSVLYTRNYLENRERKKQIDSVTSRDLENSDFDI